MLLRKIGWAGPGPVRDRKTFRIEFLSGDNNRPYSTDRGMRGNPLIMLFLEWDVEHMNRMTGGSKPYLQGRIKAAFRDSGRVQPTTFMFDGKSVEGTLVSVQPFQNDKNLVRPKFRPFGTKVYEFLLSPAIPGGIYRIRTHTPGDTEDTPLHEESVTFSRFVP